MKRVLPFPAGGVIVSHNAAIVLGGLAGPWSLGVPRKPLCKCAVRKLGEKLALCLTWPSGHASLWPGRHVCRSGTETTLIESTAGRFQKHLQRVSLPSKTNKSLPASRGPGIPHFLVRTLHSLVRAGA